MNTTLQTKSENSNRTRKNSGSVFYCLFAQDLVSYVISIYNPSFKIPSIIDNCAEQDRNPFNESLRNAVNCILFCVHRKNRYSFKYLSDMNEDMHLKFMKCALKLENTYFSRGFSLTNFLYYCVDITIMSTAFLNIGIKDASMMAVMHIIDIMECNDRRKIFDKLDLIAEGFPCVSKSSLNKAQNRLRDDLELFLSPLREISEKILSSGSLGVSSGIVIKFDIV